MSPKLSLIKVNGSYLFTTELRIKSKDVIFFNCQGQDERKTVVEATLYFIYFQLFSKEMPGDPLRRCPWATAQLFSVLFFVVDWTWSAAVAISPILTSLHQSDTPNRKTAGLVSNQLENRKKKNGKDEFPLASLAGQSKNSQRTEKKSTVQLRRSTRTQTFTPTSEVRSGSSRPSLLFSLLKIL